MTEQADSRILKLVIINGSYQQPSKTSALAQLLAAQIATVANTEITEIVVSQLGTGFTDALTREELSGDGLAAVETVETADILIAASPVYRGSYSGLFKHFFDFVDQYALANKLTYLVATGGSERHALVLEHSLRPLLGFFQADVAPVGIYASSGDFDGTTLLNMEAYARIEVAVEDVASRLDILTQVSEKTLRKQSDNLGNT